MTFTTRDLINAGVFSALYFSALMLTGMLMLFGPLFGFVGWVFGIILGSVIFSVYVMRVPRFGAATLMLLITGLIYVVIGAWAPIIFFMLACGVLADTVLTIGRAERIKRIPYAYAVFCLWIVATLFPMLFNSDELYSTLAEMMGQQYADSMRELVTIWFAAGWLVVVIMVAFFAAFGGRAIYLKNFSRSGLA
ncbi:MptD family putative ECF transporter S component [Corynebacterium sp. TAE3-ERU12]|uniref:MptD family putative ECF transporter S component n=1 Tax=Corynebacterium sp. TAE3-ERU12 TaxID=2849491 RepID=UPI001C4617E8|nr:MptD family putative ECF transporter S component [Corynebacterium sp. TAE3-ERU12]MBV7295620.1 MptD family putative ECF transporter S component [Corynebacterium sp. TAE3-ERU12]